MQLYCTFIFKIYNYIYTFFLYLLHLYVQIFNLKQIYCKRKFINKKYIHKWIWWLIQCINTVYKSLVFACFIYEHVFNDLFICMWET